jgi:hypothetical protein
MPDSLPLTEQSVAARLERLPFSRWHIKVTIFLGVAIFFDSFDSLAIAYVLPAIIPAWHIAPAKIGGLIAIANLGQDLAYMDQPEFAKFWDEDAKRMRDAIQGIGRVQG